MILISLMAIKCVVEITRTTNSYHAGVTLLLLLVLLTAARNPRKPATLKRIKTKAMKKMSK